MVYENCKIYGPYQSKDDGRLRIVVIKDGIKRTVSYPKYLVEISLDRYLLPNETVDHIDCDFTNNDLSNLRVLDRVDHIKLDIKRIEAQLVDCPTCGAQVKIKSISEQKRKNSKAIGFCSRHCSGLYGQKVQINKKAKIVTNYKSKYTTLKLKK